MMKLTTFKLLPVIFCTLMLFASSACSAAPKTIDVTTLPLDRQLILSLTDKNLEQARALLELGANPEAILGEESDDHAVCTALDDRSSIYYELLVEYGANPNAYFDVGYDSRRTPLGCAILLQNTEGFEYLLANGADPGVDLCKECSADPIYTRSAITSALSSNNYPMVIAILEVYDPNPGEIARIQRNLENYDFDEAHPWNQARDKIIAWAESRNLGFNPNPASPPTDGILHQCVFSFRDLEEGLTEGTNCRE